MAEYPDEETDNGCAPFPILQQPANGSTQGQSATYTGHGIDSTEAMFATQLGESQEQIPISATGAYTCLSCQDSSSNQSYHTLWVCMIS